MVVMLTGGDCGGRVDEVDRGGRCGQVDCGESYWSGRVGLLDRVT